MQGPDELNLRYAAHDFYAPRVSIARVVFCMLYAPCLACSVFHARSVEPVRHDQGVLLAPAVSCMAPGAVLSHTFMHSFLFWIDVGVSLKPSHLFLQSVLCASMPPLRVRVPCKDACRLISSNFDILCHVLGATEPDGIALAPAPIWTKPLLILATKKSTPFVCFNQCTRTWFLGFSHHVRTARSR